MKILLWSIGLLTLAACDQSSSSSSVTPAAEPSDPAEVTVGERLFLETRFAEFFHAHAAGNVNAQLLDGDPALDFTDTAAGQLPGPYAGLSMNCSACHLVDQQDGQTGGGLRTYCDFTGRSPIPDRADGRTHTVRNSPPMVDASEPRPDGIFLHADGQFLDDEALVTATLTGRNFGWLPDEHDTAMAHIANVIRGDDGQGALAQQFGSLSWRDVFSPGPSVPADFRIPVEFRLDVMTATDQQVLDAVARLTSAYVRSLAFARSNGRFEGSAYDLFLEKNDLPQRPNPGETDVAYSRRLRKLTLDLEHPKFVTEADGELTHHSHAFVFGLTELAGLRMFMNEPQSVPPTPDVLAVGHIGSCLICHPAPRFTDGRFHNVGTAQEEFDSVHGSGSFASLFIPDVMQRDLAPDQYLPASPQHPTWLGTYLSIPSSMAPDGTDLGLWNVFANPDQPAPQSSLRDALQSDLGLSAASDALLLESSIARFKVPSLRDLGHSQPYMHTGRFSTVETVIGHYIGMSAKARAGLVRNAAPELSAIALRPSDVAALAAFLRSLDEDYE